MWYVPKNSQECLDLSLSCRSCWWLAYESRVVIRASFKPIWNPRLDDATNIHVCRCDRYDDVSSYVRNFGILLLRLFTQKKRTQLTVVTGRRDRINSSGSSSSEDDPNARSISRESRSIDSNSEMGFNHDKRLNYLQSYNVFRSDRFVFLCYGGSGPRGPPVLNLTAFFLCSRHRLTLISNGVRPGTISFSLLFLPSLPYPRPRDPSSL